MERIGKKIVELRKQNNKSQRVLADYLGVSVQCLSNWEIGKRQVKTNQLIKIAEFFAVPVDYLILEEQETPQPTQQATEQEKQELVQLIKQMDEESLKEALKVFELVVQNQESIKESQAKLDEKIGMLLDYLK